MSSDRLYLMAYSADGRMCRKSEGGDGSFVRYSRQQRVDGWGRWRGSVGYS